jgi:hypothetical protein
MTAPTLKVLHTLAPWTLDGRTVLGRAFDGSMHAIVERVRGGSPGEADANARLIAAAPDLLTAAETAISFLRCIEWTDDSTARDSCDIEQLLEDAIEKADSPQPAARAR